jgi:hypothetical protein
MTENTTATAQNETVSASKEEIAAAKVARATARLEKAKADAKAILPVYKRTLKVAGRANQKTITGCGTAKDLAKALKVPAPLAIGFINGFVITGNATEDKTVAGPFQTKGRRSRVFNFNLNAE